MQYSKMETFSSLSWKRRLWNSGLFSFNDQSNSPNILIFSIYLLQNFCHILNNSFKISTEPHKVSSSSLLNIPRWFIAQETINIYQLDWLTDAVVISIAIYEALFILFFVFFGYKLSKNQVIENTLANSIQKVLKTHYYVLSFLIYNILLGFIFQVNQNSNSFNTKFGLIFLLTVVIIINLLICYLSILLNLPIIQNCNLAMSNSSSISIKLVHNCLISLLYLVGEYNSRTMSLEISIINLCFSILDFYFIHFQKPMFNQTVMRITIYANSIALGWSLANFVVYFTIDSQLSTSIIILGMIFSLLMVKISHILSIKDDFSFDLLLEINRHSNPNSFLNKLSRLVEFHTTGCDIIRSAAKIPYKNLVYLSLKRDKGNQMDGRELENKLPIQLISLLKEILINPTQPALIRLNAANILIQNKAECHQVYSICHKILNVTNQNLRVYLTASKILTNMTTLLGHSFLEGERTKFVSYFNSIKANEELNTMIEESHALRIKVFSLLIKQTPCLHEIQTLAYQAIDSQNKVINYWDQIPEDIRDLTNDMRKLFAQYMASIDTSKANMILTRYSQTKFKDFAKIKFPRKNFELTINRKTVSMFINLDPNEHGKIIRTSANISKIIGYDQKYLEGKHFESITPSILQQDFIKNISEKMNELDSSENVTSSVSFLKIPGGSIRSYHGTCCLFPLSNDSICLWIVMSFHKDHQEYILIDKDGFIDSHTEKIGKDLNIDNNNKVKIDQISSEISETIKSFKTSNDINSSPSVNFLVKNNKRFTYCLKAIDHQKSRFIVEFLSSSTSPFMKNSNIRPSYIFQEQSVQDSQIDLSLIDVPEEFSEEEMKKDPITVEYQSDGPNNSAKLSKILELLKFNKTSQSQNQGSNTIRKSQKNFTSGSNGSIERKKDKHNTIDRFPDDIGSNHNEPEVAETGSVSSIKRHKKKEYGLNEIIHETKFYKFKQVFIPLIVVTIFVVIYLITIFISYQTTLSALEEVNKRVYIFDQLSGRSRFTLEICRVAYANLLYRDFFSNGFAFRVNNALASPNRIGNISMFNSNLKIGLSHIEDESLHKIFFEENIKIYHSNYEEIQNNDDFTYTDSFTATNILISTTERLIKILLTDNPEQYELEYFIMTNSFNDLAIQNLNLMHEIGNNILKIIHDVVFLNNIMLKVTLILLFFSILSVFVVYLKSHRDFCTFLSSFIDPGNDYLYTFILAMQSHRSKPTHLDRAKKNDRKSIGIKLPNRTLVRRNLLFRLFLLFGIILSPVGLLIKSNDIIQYNQNQIESTTKDLELMNDLRMHGLYTIALSILSYTYPDGKSLYRSNWENFLIENNKLLDLISSNVGFSDAINTDLNQNVCDHYVTHPTRPNCTTLSGGIATSGTTSAVISVQTYYSHFIRGLETANGNITEINNLITGKEFLDNYYIISNGVSPALGVYQFRLIETLNTRMTAESDIAIVLFAIGAFLGIAIISLVYGCTSFVLWKERKKLSKLIMIVPPRYLINNKTLRLHLLEQTREFGRIMKKIELSKVV